MLVRFRFKAQEAVRLRVVKAVHSSSTGPWSSAMTILFLAGDALNRGSYSIQLKNEIRDST
jgi:hypothetical protein